MATEEQFHSWVKEGVETLPSWVQGKLTNVALLVALRPSRRQRTENHIGAHETLFGLYEGVPLVERGNESPLLPDTITIFIEPIREAYEREEDMRTCVHNTIWHEVAHYFGHDEAWVEAEEKRRGKEM